MVDVAIIGCGVTGAAVAYQLAKKQVSVLILEAENDVSMGTTKANSAILHAGYDPEPGTSMARLNVRGSALAKEICAALDVPYKQTGSFVVAFGPEQEKTLQRLYENGAANGVPGLEILSGDEARALEPNLSPEITAALHAPSAAIVSPWEFALAMAENAVQNGADLHLETRVTGLAPIEGGWKIATTKGDFEARFVVNAAGVDAGKVHAMAAPENFVTRPCRGEYYLLDKSAGSTVGRVIFQCPTAAGKGVLVAGGAILAIQPVLLPFLALIFLACLLPTGMVSLGSVTMAAAYPLLTLGYCLLRGYAVQDLLICLVGSVIMAAMVIYMHRSNIQRIRDGKEYRFGRHGKQ